MALTATAQSAFPTGPSWDETIVPALRKRLEGESRILSKRMSAASITSMEENSIPNLSPSSDTTMRNRSPTYSLQSQNGAGSVSRPTLNQSRTVPNNHPNTAGTSRSNGTGQTPLSKSSAPMRKRTKSQPFSFDSTRLPNGHVNGTSHTNGVLPTPEGSRPTSPMYVGRTSDVKPTRIPMVARSSTSSHGHTQSPPNGGRSESRNGDQSPYNLPTPEASPDLWAVEESTPSIPSRSTESVLIHQRSGLLNEPAPFNPNSATSSATSQRSHEQRQHYDTPPRPSTESEERPFEHWYRGEVSRNGGVGELRVGKRIEMLDIANYGHSIRKAPPSRIPSDSQGGSIVDAPRRRRRRADSVVGIGARESFYMDDERAREIEMVMDESPLTDLDGEGTETDPESSYATANGYYSPTQPPPMPAFAAEDYRSATPTSHRAPSRQQSAPPTRIPMPATRQSSDPPRSITPTQSSRGVSEPPSASTSRARTPSAPQSIPRSASTPQKTQKTQPETPKRRAKSPASVSSTSASKKAKTKPRPAASKRGEDHRRSVAEYPAPPTDGEDMVDAIPSWTQSVPAGNWDEVVLPVVARKKGLDEHYQQADGSPQLRKPRDNPVEPAPGTFGYDHSKYRPPRGEQIPLDEFGQNRTDAFARVAEEVEQEDGPHRWRDTLHDERRIHIPKSPPSPAPFAHYSPTHTPQIENMIPETRPPPDLEQGHQEDDGSAGCCKCVIM